MDLGLEDRFLVVGGASRGLGRAVANALVAEGARVLLVARDSAALERAAGELGERADWYAADLADPVAIDGLAARIGREKRGLDGVLVNAGGPPGGETLTLSDEQWADAFRLLLGGPIRLLRVLVPRMNEGGSIVFITSSSVRQPIPGLDASSVLRPGVAALAKCLALQLGPRIRVNSVAPGRIATERMEEVDEIQAGHLGITLEEQRERTGATIPLGRYGEPAELGRVVAFLLSPSASYVSGVFLQVDGGFLTAVP